MVEHDFEWEESREGIGSNSIKKNLMTSPDLIQIHISDETWTNVQQCEIISFHNPTSLQELTVNNSTFARNGTVTLGLQHSTRQHQVIHTTAIIRIRLGSWYSPPPVSRAQAALSVGSDPKQQHVITRWLIIVVRFFFRRFFRRLGLVFAGWLAAGCMPDKLCQLVSRAGWCGVRANSADFGIEIESEIRLEVVRNSDFALHTAAVMTGFGQQTKVVGANRGLRVGFVGCRISYCWVIETCRLTCFWLKLVFQA